MNSIVLHIIQSFPVTCLNRDDLGSPKSALFGGATRARVSSQCWKRAIRLWARDEKKTMFAGVRSNLFVQQLKESLVAAGTLDDDAKKVAELVYSFYTGTQKILEEDEDGGEGENGETTSKSKVLLFLSPAETQALTECVKERLPELLAEARKKEEKKDKGKKDKKLSKECQALKKAMSATIKKLQPKDAVDISIFGRMVACDQSLSVEGAVQVSHWFSTHAVSNETDFFSAVDELQDKGTSGAAHIGTREHNSPCYYRCLVLNLDLLCDEDHLGHFTPAERQEAVGIFLRAALESVPAACRNSMFSNTRPGFVLGLAMEGDGISLANAFEVPIVSTNGIQDASEAALEKHFAEMKRTWCWKPEEHRLSNKEPNEDRDTFVKGLVTHVR